MLTSRRRSLAYCEHCWGDDVAESTEPLPERTPVTMITFPTMSTQGEPILFGVAGSATEPAVAGAGGSVL